MYIRLVVQLAQQLSRRDTKRHRQLLDHSDSWVPPPALDIADIGTMDAGAVGIVLLAPALCLAQAANVLTQARANIHVQVKTPVSAIDLQTMSDIRS